MVGVKWKIAVKIRENSQTRKKANKPTKIISSFLVMNATTDYTNAPKHPLLKPSLKRPEKSNAYVECINQVTSSPKDGSRELSRMLYIC